MISEAVDFRFLLLENYKKLRINENELAIIFMIDHLVSQGNPFITADLLSLKMTLDIKEIDALIANLLTRGFMEYVTLNGRTVTSLNPLKERLYREFEISVSKEAEAKGNAKIKEELNNIYGTFEQDEEPSYDIMVDGGDESGLYKHCRESRIIEKTGRYNKK